MHPSVKDIWNAATELADPGLAESWDNIGIQAGDPEQKVKRVMVALDLTAQLLKASVTQDVQMVITHHPVLFRPLKKIDLANPVTRLILSFINHGIAIASAHTNLDSAHGGVSDVMADAAGLEETKPILPSPTGISGAGFGRIGNLNPPAYAKDFLNTFCNKLNIETAKIAGNINKKIRTVALCGGSGSDIWPSARDMNADIFISGEIKHNIAIEAVILDRIVVDAGHWATERPIVPVFAKRLHMLAAEKGWNLEVFTLDNEKNPLVNWRPNKT